MNEFISSGETKAKSAQWRSTGKGGLVADNLVAHAAVSIDCAPCGEQLPDTLTMAINPLSYAEKILRSFLRYQLTA